LFRGYLASRTGRRDRSRYYMTSESIPEYPENANSIHSKETKIIEDIIAELRITIDQLDVHFAKAKKLILELARQLDETKQCKQSQICRKIKDILEDKIKEGKISEKWIEECLPQEYKRKYTKSEVSSLSKQSNSTTEREKEKDLIIVDSARPYIKTDDTWPNNHEGEDIASAANPQLREESNEEGVGRNQITKPVKGSQLIGQTVIKKSLEEGQCPDCLLLSIENNELKEALANSTQFILADKISENEVQFTIPKDKYQQVKAAMDNSTNSVYVTFDKSGILERAEPEYS
jgi:hypothetical protein